MRRLIPDIRKQHHRLWPVHGVQLGPRRLEPGRPAARRLRQEEQAHAPAARARRHRHRHGLFPVPRRLAGHGLAGLPGQNLARSGGRPARVPERARVRLLAQAAQGGDGRFPPDSRLLAALHVVHVLESVGFGVGAGGFFQQRSRRRRAVGELEKGRDVARHVLERQAGEDRRPEGGKFVREDGQQPSEHQGLEGRVAGRRKQDFNDRFRCSEAAPGYYQGFEEFRGR